MSTLRYASLDLYPMEEESEFSAATAGVFLRCAPDEAVCKTREWLATQGWITNRVLRHFETKPEDWHVESDDRRMAEAALSGTPQIRTRRVRQEHWSLGGSPTQAVGGPTVSEFALAIRVGGATWLESEDGVEGITSPAGESVVPMWIADAPPTQLVAPHGRRTAVELESLIDNVLLEVDQHGDLIGMGRGDDMALVHPAMLRRRILMEPDPKP